MNGSETNVAESTQAVTTAAGKNPQIDKPNYVLELVTFADGNNKGFKFWCPTFKTLPGAIEHFTLNSTKGEKGEDVILALVNSAMAFRLRSQATGRLIAPNDKGQGGMAPTEKLERLKAGGDQLIIITEKDAETYVPGQREVDSLSGFLKTKAAIAKQIKDTKSAGPKGRDALVELLKKYKEVDLKIKELQDAEEAKLLEGINLEG